MQYTSALLHEMWERLASLVVTYLIGKAKLVKIDLWPACFWFVCVLLIFLSFLCDVICEIIWCQIGNVSSSGVRTVKKSYLLSCLLSYLMNYEM